MFEYDTPERAGPPFEVGGHRVEPLPDHRDRALVCVRCSGEGDARHDFLGNPCPRA